MQYFPEPNNLSAGEINIYFPYLNVSSSFWHRCYKKNFPTIFPVYIIHYFVHLYMVGTLLVNALQSWTITSQLFYSVLAIESSPMDELCPS